MGKKPHSAYAPSPYRIPFFIDVPIKNPKGLEPLGLPFYLIFLRNHLPEAMSPTSSANSLAVA
jgi:hypothetical protein